MTVPNTAWGQISKSTKMACGAREPVAKDENTLRFKVTIKPGVSNFIEVRLDPSDTYTVTLIQERGGVTTEKEKHDDIYCDVLSDVIYRMCNK